MMFHPCLQLASALLLAAGARHAPLPSESPLIFPVTIHQENPEHGAVLQFGDLTGAGQSDYILIGDRGLCAYATDGTPLWDVSEPVRYYGGPTTWDADNPHSLFPCYCDTVGVCEDVDADGENEFVYLAGDGFRVRIRDGASGDLKCEIDVRQAFGEEQPFTYVQAGRLFDREAPTSLVLFRHHYHVPHEGLDSLLAFDLRDVESGVRWRHEELWGINYAPPRIVDLDGDGLDEVITGIDCFAANGARLWQMPRNSDQFTTLQIGDFLAGRGLEVAVGEYGHAGRDTGLTLAGMEAMEYLALSQNTHSAAPGRFVTEARGEQLLIRNNTHTGREDVRDHRILVPEWPEASREITVARLDTAWKNVVEGRGNQWFPEGRAQGEYPRPIRWLGTEEYQILAVERHTPNPRASVHDWRTGACLARAEKRGMIEGGVRVCDVFGDAREEFVIWNQHEVAVYFNPKRLDSPLRRTPREEQIYRRLKSVGNVVYNAP